MKSIENCEVLRSNCGRIFLERKNVRERKKGIEMGAEVKHAIRDLEWCWDRCSASVCGFSSFPVVENANFPKRQGIAFGTTGTYRTCAVYTTIH